MIALPMFGEDSPIQRSSMLVSVIVTCSFWIIFLVLVVVIKPKEKPAEEKFKTVQIVLADLPPVEKKIQNSSPKPAETPDAGAQEIPVVEAAVPTPVQAAVKDPVPAVQKTQTPVKQNSKPVETPKVDNLPVVEVKDQPIVSKPVTTPVPEQKTSTPKTEKPAFDWSMFDDDPAPAAQTTTPKKVATTTQSAITGTAGTSASTTSSTTTSSSSTQKTNTPSTASSSTTNQIDAIAKANTGANTGATNTASTPAKTSSVSTGNITLNFNEGGVRSATTPLSIKLSSDAQKLIEQSVSIVIRISIETDGSILRPNILVPSSVLNSAVRNEIINQIMRWKFDSADTITTASFKFNIVVQ